MFTQGLRPRFRVRRVVVDERPVNIEQYRLELETHFTTRPRPGGVHVAMHCTVDAALASENVDSVTWNGGAARPRFSTHDVRRRRASGMQSIATATARCGISGVRRASCRD